MKKLIFPALWLLSLATAALLAFQAGRASALGPSLGQTFYAVIDQIDGSFLTVTGLEVNDINHRGAVHLLRGGKHRSGVAPCSHHPV